jgi:ATPase family AAA domain-containing protein 3A/B
MQEEAAVRQEQIRRSTEEQIQAQRRQTEKERAEIERETLRVRAMAEAEGRAYEAKAAEDVNRRMLIERANMEKEKWLAAINSTFGHIGGTHSWNMESLCCGYMKPCPLCWHALELICS